MFLREHHAKYPIPTIFLVNQEKLHRKQMRDNIKFYKLLWIKNIKYYADPRFGRFLGPILIAKI